MTHVVFHLMVAVCSASFIYMSHRIRPQPAASVLGLLVAGFASCALVLVVGRFGFLSMQFASYVIFVYGPIVISVMAYQHRKTHRKFAAMCVLCVAVLVGIAIDAFFIEPHWLEVTYVEVRSDKVEKSFRIVVISDLQTDNVGEYERNVLERAMAEKPDMILLPGDYIHVWDTETWQRERKKLRKILTDIKFRAPMGVYAVEGNTDPVGWVSIFAGFDVHASEETQSIERDGIRVTALSFSDGRKTNLRVEASGGDFHIVVSHYPDFALGQVNADLLVAGHTHGGQVRLPFIGPLMTLSRVPRSWAAGVTHLPALGGTWKEGERTLVVSRGIGMERAGAPRLRFLCRPELVVIDVVKR